MWIRITSGLGTFNEIKYFELFFLKIQSKFLEQKQKLSCQALYYSFQFNLKKSDRVGGALYIMYKHSNKFCFEIASTFFFPF
jgi:hypothetical protein